MQLTQVTTELYRERMRQSKRNGAPEMRPNAQTSGSARGVICLSFFAANMPIATPEKPARHVMMPNMKLTLKHRNAHIYKYIAPLTNHNNDSVARIITACCCFKKQSDDFIPARLRYRSIIYTNKQNSFAISHKDPVPKLPHLVRSLCKKIQFN